MIATDEQAVSEAAAKMGIHYKAAQRRLPGIKEKFLSLVEENKEPQP